MKPVLVKEVTYAYCNLCDQLAQRTPTVCARVQNLYICFKCAGQILTAIQTQAVFIEAPGAETGPEA